MAKKTDDTDADGKVMEQKVTREINFKLSPEQQQEMANTAARLTEERNTIKTELDLYGRTKRKEIKDLQKEIDRLLACHKNGSERREAEVVERLDWEAGTVTTFHHDEQIGEREMHDSEKQMKLNPAGNSTAKKVGKKTRAQKDPDKHLTPEEQEQSDIQNVHRLESSRKTKKSALDKNH